MSQLWLQTLVAATLSDLATGLGALPFAFKPHMTARWRGIAAAVAGGMMTGASVFSLTVEGLKHGTAWEVALGLMIGSLFFWSTARYLERHEHKHGGFKMGLSRQGLLTVITMFIHSTAEGFAIGVGFATGDYTFGVLIALVISVHNIPEGIAVSLPLRAEGVGVLKCVGYSIFTSLPQPIVAVPAVLLVSFFKQLLPVGLGFAGGAMIYLVVVELLPESLEHCTRHETAWSLMAGLSGMLLFVAIFAI